MLAQALASTAAERLCTRKTQLSNAEAYLKALDDASPHTEHLVKILSRRGRAGTGRGRLPVLLTAALFLRSLAAAGADVVKSLADTLGQAQRLPLHRALVRVVQRSCPCAEVGAHGTLQSLLDLLCEELAACHA